MVRVAYLAAGQELGSGAQVVAVRELNYSISVFYDFQHNLRVADFTWPQAYNGVTWTNGGALIYLEDLSDARANDLPGTTTGACWQMQHRQPGFRGGDTMF